MSVTGYAKQILLDDENIYLEQLNPAIITALTEILQQIQLQNMSLSII